MQELRPSSPTRVSAAEFGVTQSYHVFTDGQNAAACLGLGTARSASKGKTTPRWRCGLVWKCSADEHAAEERRVERAERAERRERDAVEYPHRAGVHGLGADDNVGHAVWARVHGRHRDADGRRRENRTRDRQAPPKIGVRR